MADKEWSPDEPDPLELQKEQLALGKEFLERLKKQEADEKAARAEYEARAVKPIAGLGAYVPPTPDEVSGVFKKAWEKTKEIIPDAPAIIQLHTFQALVQAFAPRPPSIGGI